MDNSAKQIGWILLTITLVAAAGAQTTKDTLIDKETQIYEAVKKQDSKTFASLLTDDSVVVWGAEVESRDAHGSPNARPARREGGEFWV
jgi:hypothetical protein